MKFPGVMRLARAGRGTWPRSGGPRRNRSAFCAPSCIGWALDSARTTRLFWPGDAYDRTSSLPAGRSQFLSMGASGTGAPNTAHRPGGILRTGAPSLPVMLKETVGKRRFYNPPAGSWSEFGSMTTPPKQRARSLRRSCPDEPQLAPSPCA